MSDNDPIQDQEKVQAFVTWSDDSGKRQALSDTSDNIDSYDGIQKSVGYNRRSFLDIEPKTLPPLLSAIAFGIYHWFSYGVLGNIMGMLFVFIGTGLMGYAWALAFSKTKSIILPFGLHLGWNFTYNTIFSNGPLGELLLISQGGNELTGWASLLNFINGLIIIPVLVLIYVRYFVKEETEIIEK